MQLKKYCSVACIILMLGTGFLFINTSNKVVAISTKGGFSEDGTLTVGQINDMAYYPDGRRIAIAAEPIPEIVNLSSKKIEMTLIGQNGTIKTISVSNKYIASGSEDGSVFLWSMDGKVIVNKTLGWDIIKVRFSPDGSRLAVISAGNQSLQLFSVPDLKKQWEYKLDYVDEMRGGSSLEWNPNGSMIAVTLSIYDSQIVLLNSSTGHERERAPEYGVMDLFGVTWNSTGSSFAFINSNNPFDYEVEVWDALGNKSQNTLSGIEQDSRSLCWLPNSNHIVVGARRSLTVWFSNYSMFQTFPYDYAEIDFVGCNPKGNQFVAHSNTDLQLWSWKSDFTIERPQVKIDEPSPLTKVFGNLTISGTAWGPSPIREVRIRIDNGPWIRPIGTTDWSLTMDISDLSPGLHTIVAISYDGSNFSEPDYRTINITKKTSDYQITVRIYRPFDGDRVYDNVSVEGSYYNPKNYAMVKAQLLLDTGEWFDISNYNSSCEYRWNTSNASNGWHIIYAKAFDGYKWSNIASVTVYVYNQGNVPPPIPPKYLFIDYPTEGQVVNGTVDVQGRVKFPFGTPSLSISVQGGTWINLTGAPNWVCHLSTTSLPDGPAVIRVKAFNGINLSQEVDRTIIINNHNFPPSKLYLIIDQPLEGQVVNGTITVKGRVAFPTGTATVSLSIQNGNWISLGSGPDWSYQLDTTAFSNGPLNITAKASNGLGMNLTASRTVSVSNQINVNNKAPTVKITRPSKGDKLNALSTIEGKASDDVKVTAVYVKIDNSSWQLTSGTDDWNFVCNTKLSLGHHSIQARSFDGALSSSIQSVDFEITNGTVSPPAKKPSIGTYVVDNLVPILLVLLIIICVSFILFYNWRHKQELKARSRKEIQARRKKRK